MKTLTMGAAALLLLVSLSAVAVSFARPAETASKQEVKLLDYKQNGEFRYQVQSKPSFLYDAVPASAPEPIPAAAIQSFSMTFSYSSTRTVTAPVRLSATIVNAANWKKTVPIPTDNFSGQAVAFALDLKSLQATADTINKELGTSSSSLDLTIQAVVPGGATTIDGQNAEFVQDLPIKVTRTLVKIGDALSLSQGGTTGRFAYQVVLGDNSLYGPVTLTSAPAPSYTSVTLGPADTIFVKLIDSIAMDYRYYLTSSQPVRQSTAEVKIDATVSNSDVWSKTYILVPSVTKTGDFSLTFPLDLSQFSGVFDTIQQQTGVGASKEQLALTATVHLTAVTDQGKIDKTFTQSIATDLRAGVLAFTGDMTKSEPGSITQTRIVSQAARLLGIPVAEIRIVSLVVAAIMAIALLAYAWTARNKRSNPAAEIARHSAEIDRKYKAMIVEVKELPAYSLAERVISVDTIEDLMKVGQGLLKPVHHASDTTGHVYWVYDDHKRYEFSLILTQPSSAPSEPAKN